MEININENKGMIKVSAKDKSPISKVYVKVFAKLSNGKSEFFRDGYTDIRGSFNYCDVKNSRTDDISKFAIFISEEGLGNFKFIKGCLIKECYPPKLKEVNHREVQLGSKNWAQYQQESSKANYGRLMNRANLRKMKKKKF